MKDQVYSWWLSPLILPQKYIRWWLLFKNEKKKNRDYDKYKWNWDSQWVAMTPMLLAINLVWFLTLKLGKKVSLFNGILWFSGFLWDWLISAEVKQPSGEAPFRKSLLSPSAGVVEAPQDFVPAWLSLSPGSLPLFLFPGVGWQQTKAGCSTTLALFFPLKTSQNMLLNFLLPSLNPTFLKGKIRGNGQKNSLAELSSHIIDNYWPRGNKKGRAEKSRVGSMHSKWRSETRFGNKSGKRNIKITGCGSRCWETQGEGDTEVTLECREGEEKNKILPWSLFAYLWKEKTMNDFPVRVDLHIWHQSLSSISKQ